MVIFTLHKDSIELYWDKKPASEKSRARIIKFAEVKKIKFSLANKQAKNFFKNTITVFLIIIAAFTGEWVNYRDVASQEIEMEVESKNGIKEIFDIVLWTYETKEIHKQIQERILEVNENEV